MAEKLLEVKNLKINFKTDNGLVQAVRDVSFDLKSGETLCIVGESGSGKSVTSKAIMGILANNAIIEDGVIIYNGENLLEVSEEEFHKIRGHKIGMIFQDPLSSLNPIVKIGKQITEATLVNANKLKKLFEEKVAKELTTYKNKIAKTEARIKGLTNREMQKVEELSKIYNDIHKPKEERKEAKEKAKEIKKELNAKVKEMRAVLKEEIKPLKAAYLEKKKVAKAEVKEYHEDLKAVKKNKLDVKVAELKAISKEEQAAEKVKISEIKEKYKADLKAASKTIKAAKALDEREHASVKKQEILNKQEAEILESIKTKQVKREIALIKKEYIDKVKITKSEAKRRAIEIMKEVGIPLPEKRFYQYPFEFSGGMRQRIVIAIALTASPEILICDEPTTALDVTIQAQILELIKKIQKERNIACMFITHDLGVVANMADRVAVMYAGEIVEYGLAEEIFFEPKHPYTWALLASIPDIDSKEKLDAIPGTPPNMIYPPKGDAFALRSKYAMKIDFEKNPPYFKVSDTHYAKTWLLHKDAPKVEMPSIVKKRIEEAKNNR